MARLGFLLVSLFATATAAGAGQVDVKLDGDRVTLHATSAPLSDVLDSLARQTGMAVVYDGAPPSNAIDTTLQGVTAPQAVYSVLEGLGLNYMLMLDSSGRRVATLMMISSTGGGTTSAAPRPPEPVVYQPAPEAPEEFDDVPLPEPEPEPQVEPEPAAPIEGGEPQGPLPAPGLSGPFAPAPLAQPFGGREEPEVEDEGAAGEPETK